ncbi:MAG: 2-C-methyl-D-erythritol 2,4-cyclodiphosphate synthase [Deltaproteobacteria bacterium]|nr:2-C-methyl-D-erythritol 2,4-cyclodiphosphate synthase [Deltaproteobacteria bacterium]
MSAGFRIGTGYDVHRLVPGRPLIIGGVRIEHESGLLGHSDADVLAHAIADAVLGAAGLGDIGRHFPDTDVAFKDADSIALLERVVALVRERGFTVVNVDSTIIAQAPKMAPHIGAMTSRLAAALGVGESCVNVKATTEEELGFTGARLGIAVQAVALLAVR